MPERGSIVIDMLEHVQAGDSIHAAVWQWTFAQVKLEQRKPRHPPGQLFEGPRKVIRTDQVHLGDSPRQIIQDESGGTADIEYAKRPPHLQSLHAANGHSARLEVDGMLPACLGFVHLRKVFAPVAICHVIGEHSDLGGPQFEKKSGPAREGCGGREGGGGGASHGNSSPRK